MSIQKIETLFVVKVGDCYLSSPGVTTRKEYATKFTLKTAQKKKDAYKRNGYGVTIIPVDQL